MLLTLINCFLFEKGKIENINRIYIIMQTKSQLNMNYDMYEKTRAMTNISFQTNYIEDNFTDETKIAYKNNIIVNT